jgi:hypothetical protein
MRHSTLFQSSALCILFAAGCDTATNQQEKAVTAQTEADTKIIAATKEANDKVATAQIEADKKIADAQANFLKLREDYRHTTTNNLVEFERKAAELEGKAKLAKGKARIDMETKLQQIRAGRTAFAADYKQLESETAVSWDATKARLDKQWADLKALAE